MESTSPDVRLIPRKADICSAHLRKRTYSICILWISYVVDRPHYIRHRKSSFAQNFLNGRKAVACLGGHLGGHRHGFIVVTRCARDECKITINDRTAVTGKLFE